MPDDDIKTISQEMIDRIAAASGGDVVLPPRRLKSPLDPVPGETLPGILKGVARGTAQDVGDVFNPRPQDLTEPQRWHRMLTVGLADPKLGRGTDIDRRNQKSATANPRCTGRNQQDLQKRKCAQHRSGGKAGIDSREGGEGKATCGGARQ